MKRLIAFYILIFLLLIKVEVFATHQRAAEITYKHISGYTYEFTLITYTFSLSPADRPQLEVNWGDGNSSILQRTQKTAVTGYNNIDKNTYIGTHTYAAPSTYVVTMLDPNRNQGVINIPNSVNVPIFISTTLVINPFVGPNNSPILSNPPLDRGCVGVTFYHNPGAIDPEGDSLAYKLIPCRGDNGQNIIGYSYPFATNSFSIDQQTGTLTWDSPAVQGEYNVAIQINEYRNGVLLSSITRDMQINILACDNQPPKIITINDTCITAGEKLEFNVLATDPNPNDNLRLTATGGPFSVNNSPAIFPTATGNSPINSTFEWNTNCSHVRKAPYIVYFRAEDRNSTINLIDIKVTNIRVVSPAPKNLVAQAAANSVMLNWESTICKNASGYKIYRRVGPYGFTPANCETGVPAYTSYQYIGQTNSVLDTTFIDNNNGLGLIHGPEYCYMVIAYFQDGAESYASNETCVSLIKDIPIITNVSINTTDINNGSTFIAWSMPDSIDTSVFPGPYTYKLFSGKGFNPSNFNQIAQINLLTDTTYIENSLNTKDSPISYYLEFWDNSTFTPELIGTTVTSSSVFLDIDIYDRTLFLEWEENTPWSNYNYIIYRYNQTSGLFDSIGQSFTNKFTDTGLENNIEYCYYIKSIGSYFSTGLVDPIINFSQIKCETPIDMVAPCAPILKVVSDCKKQENTLSWTNPITECEYSDDTQFYNIYFSPGTNNNYQLIFTENNAFYTEYIHKLNNTIAGCYKINAVDSVGNISKFSKPVCVDINICNLYRLPNIFTPNDDNYNDFWHAFPFDFVNSIDLKLFNRWGNIVFETKDPYFKWDGRHYQTKQIVSEGTYFYVCEVEELTLNGATKRSISGSLTIIKTTNKSNF